MPLALAVSTREYTMVLDSASLMLSQNRHFFLPTTKGGLHSPPDCWRWAHHHSPEMPWAAASSSGNTAPHLPTRCLSQDGSSSAMRISLLEGAKPHSGGILSSFSDLDARSSFPRWTTSYSTGILPLSCGYPVNKLQFIMSLHRCMEEKYAKIHLLWACVRKVLEADFHKLKILTK